MTRSCVCVAICALVSCNDGAPQSAGAVIYLPQPTASGTDGTDGPFGAARVTLHANVRVSESLDVEVTYPALADGTLDRSHAPWPAVVFVQGGLVGVERYRWLANHFASRGYVVLMPAHIADLAFFQTDNAVLALEATQHAASLATGTLSHAIATDPLHPGAAVMGHSLGGVVAVRQWISHPFDAVAMLAAFPADGDPVRTRAGSPVLSLVGQNDVRKSPAQSYVNGFNQFSSPRLFARIDGMDHYAWTDDPSADDLAGDGPLTRPLGDVRRDAFRILDLWLDASLRHDMSAQNALGATTFPGTTLVLR